MKGFDGRKFGIVVIIIIVISILGFGLYSSFSGEDKNGGKGGSSTPTPTPEEEIEYPVTVVYPVELDENEKMINMNGTDVSLQIQEGKLYVNNKEVPGIDAKVAYVSDDFIILTNKADCGETVVYVIDKKGTKLNYTDNNYQLKDFRQEDSKFMATWQENCSCSDDDSSCVKEKIVFTYNGKEIIINKI